MSSLDDALRSMRQVQRFVEESTIGRIGFPLEEALRSQRTIQEALRAQAAAAEALRVHAIVGEAVRAFRDVDRLNEVLRQTKMLTELRPSALDTVEQAFRSIGLAAHSHREGIAGPRRDFQETLEVLRSTRIDTPLSTSSDAAQSSAERLVQSLREVDALEPTVSLENRSKAVTNLISALIDWARTLPPSWNAVRWVMVMVFAYLIPIYEIAHDHADDQQNAAEHKALEKEVVAGFAELADSIADLRPQETSNGVFILTRRLRLHAAASGNAKTLRFIPANSTVDQIGSDGRWIKVEFVDYTEGKVYRGWLYKRFLLQAGEH